MKIVKALKRIILYIFALIIIVGVVLVKWESITFNVSYSAILYTIQSPLKGVDQEVIKAGIKYCMPKIFILIAVFVIFDSVLCKINDKVVLYIKIRLYHSREIKCDILMPCWRVFLVAIVFVGVVYVNNTLSIGEYYYAKLHPSTLYEKYYVDPNSVSISCENDKPKNLIYIYMESMETTYADEESGGRQPDNYIPNLTELAVDNISFSNTEKLGGAYSSQGAMWTMGSLFASTSGVPFSFPMKSNDMELYSSFASGITNLGDVLYKNGYNNEFICGSDADFAGRRQYFEQHGNYKIFDYYTAIEEGYIDSDYYVGWGFEDSKLYNIAKDEIEKLSKMDEPFNCTLLTIDTHHYEGLYVCDLCQHTYDSDAANVINCADRQVEAFVEWCKEQPFYDDTVIVITGDHPRMDNYIIPDDLISNYFGRKVYNCYINVDKENVNRSNREFVQMDFFPTTLAAMGYKIEGDRLGLGTNLFSDRETLTEQLGLEVFMEEILKHSNYYLKNFM